jgi:hypothetical protein
MKKRVWWSAGACLVTVGVLVACSDDETSPGTTPTNDGGGLNLPDTGTENEVGDEVLPASDGDPEADVDDAGADFDGGLPDGGTCGPPAGDGAAITSACVATATRYAGGTITAADYDLVEYTVLRLDCGTFIPSSYSGRLVVTTVGRGFRFDERVVPSGLRARPTIRSVRGSTSGSTIMATVECGATTNDTWSYSVGSRDGKVLLTYVHDTGTAKVRYRWLQRLQPAQIQL